MKIKFEDIIKKTYIKEITDEIPIAPVFDEIEIREFSVKMRDGVTLACYGAFPVGSYEKLPVIVSRTPYTIYSLRFFFEMAFYGYIYVAQDCRGCGKSEGEWMPAENEREDGIDTLNFISNQPWCGNIALTGSSYVALCQLLVADSLPDKVKMLNIENLSPYRYEMLYTNGVFHFEAYTGWTAYNTGIQNLPCAPDELYQKFISHRPPITADTELLGICLPWYRNWLEGVEKNSPAWTDGAYALVPETVNHINIPVLFHGGWYDPHLEGMVRCWRNINPQIREKSLFIISPTNHKQALCSDLKTENEFVCGGKRFIKSKISFFEHYLKGNDFLFETPLGNAQVFVYGQNNYKTVSLAKKDDAHSFYLNCSNRKLNVNIPENNAVIEYIYNPSDPVPSCGSDVLMTDYMYHKNKKTAEGQKLMPKANYRDDVISFVSDEFAEGIEISNSISISLDVSSSAKDTAFIAKICLVDKNGDAYHLRQSACTLCIKNGEKEEYTPETIKNITFETNPVFIKIEKGCRLRVDISSSDFPSYALHPNTDRLWCHEENAVQARQKIHGGKISF